jgi:hypothetical protein
LSAGPARSPAGGRLAIRRPAGFGCAIGPRGSGGVRGPVERGRAGSLSPPADSAAGAYRGAGLLPGASWCEGFPQFPPGSIACEIPEVATHGRTEEHAARGVAADAVPARDPAAIVAGALWVLRDPAYALALATEGQRISRTFTWGRAVARFYHLVLGESAAGTDDPALERAVRE